VPPIVARLRRSAGKRPQLNALAIHAEQVREAGRAFFPSAREIVVVVGDEPKIKTELAQFGEATVVQP
jgi:hypothetical protein